MRTTTKSGNCSSVFCVIAKLASFWGTKVHNGVKPIMKLYSNFQLNLNFDSKWALLRYTMVFSSIMYPIIYIPRCLMYIVCAFSSLNISCLNQISCYFLLSVRLQAQFALKTDEKTTYQHSTVLLLRFISALFFASVSTGFEVIMA